VPIAIRTTLTTFLHYRVVVITHAKFCVNRFRGFSARTRLKAPYNISALPCCYY